MGMRGRPTKYVSTGTNTPSGLGVGVGTGGAGTVGEGAGGALIGVGARAGAGAAQAAAHRQSAATIATKRSQLVVFVLVFVFVFGFAIGDDASLSSAVHGYQEILARLICRPYQIVVNPLYQTVQILIGEVTFDDQYGVYNAGAEVNVDAPKRRLALAQQVCLRVRRTAHAVVLKIGKDHLDGFDSALGHAHSMRQNGARCENPVSPGCGC
jgi:hypothetical protein